jgi:hypothetical protein
MRTTILKLDANGNPDPGATIEVWTFLNGSPHYQSPKIGDFTDNGDGTYYIDNNGERFKGTVLVNSVVFTPMIGKFFPGEEMVLDGEITTVKLDDGAVTNPKIADGAVSPDKTDFLYE